MKPFVTTIQGIRYALDASGDEARMQAITSAVDERISSIRQAFPSANLVSATTLAMINLMYEFDLLTQQQAVKSLETPSSLTQADVDPISEPIDKPAPQDTSQDAQQHQSDQSKLAESRSPINPFLTRSGQPSYSIDPITGQAKRVRRKANQPKSTDDLGEGSQKISVEVSSDVGSDHLSDQQMTFDEVLSQPQKNRGKHLNPFR